MLAPAQEGGAGLDANDPESETTPNVVIILADDLGWGDVGAMHPESAMTTPRIDSIAEEGMRFTDAHSAASVCSPSRYGLLTGRGPWRERLSHINAMWWGPSWVGSEQATLGTLLQAHGYRTAMVGKWHLGLDFSGEVTRDRAAPGIDFAGEIGGGPVDRGFDEFFGLNANIRDGPYVYIRDDRFTAVPTRVTDANRPLSLPAAPIADGFDHEDVLDRLTEEAVAFIDRASRDPAPFFLYFALTAPHGPLLPGPRFRGKSGLGRYGDFVAHVDWVVGQVLDALDRGGERDDTLLIFTSDNGSVMEPLGEDRLDHVDYSTIRGYRSDRHLANGGWRGIKSEIWEGGHRIPWLVRWPGVVEAGSEATATVSQTDIYATLAEIVGEGRTPGVAPDSVSLLPMLRGGKAGRGVPVVHQAGSGTLAIRDGRWKLVRGAGSGGWYSSRGPQPRDPRRRQLYDLPGDPGETGNLVDDHPAVVSRLETVLDRILSSEVDHPPVNRSPAVAASLADQVFRSAVTVDLSGAFTDPDGDALTYASSSSSPAVAVVSVSGSVLTVTAVGAGEASVTVRATDAGGTRTPAIQRFSVTVPNGPLAAVGAGAVPYPVAAGLDVTVSNGPPAAVGSLSPLTLSLLDGAATVDVSGAFTDPEEDVLTHEASSSAPEVAGVSLSGSTVTVTPVSAGEATVTVTATDAGGSNASAVQAFAVRVSAVDYDADDDGLVEIATLSQLDAVRHDLDGDGAASAAGAAAYASAFPGAVSGMGCPAPGCGGYELAADLDLDTNGNGVADAGDGWWNAGSGWVPIGSSAAPFTSAFAGNGRTVSHLFANRGAGDYVGLFGMSRGTITGVGVVEADVTGRSYVGGLLGKNEGGEVRASYSTGRVAGYSVVGGLVGLNGLEIRRGGPGQARWVSRTGALRASYSTAAVSADFRVGGLVGYNLATIAASYATGSVAAGATQAPRLESSAGGLVGWGASLGEVRASYSTGRVSGRGRHVGGLIGNRLSGHETTASYWDRDTSGVVASGGGSGHATSALQGPTAYTGLYASWDVDVDGDGAADRVWDFGTSSEYPALSVDVDGDGTATWRELGLQGRTASSPGEATPGARGAVAMPALAQEGGAGFDAPDPVSEATPNVVIILADDLGWGDVGAMYPESAIATPSMDRLAEEGMRFTDAHSPAAVCTPTRYGLLTGRYSWRTRLARSVLNGYSPPLIETDRPTLGTLLQAQGYRTAAVGKWHLGMDMRRDSFGDVDFRARIADSPIHHGFDAYFGVSASLSAPPYVWIRNDRFTAVPARWQWPQRFPRYMQSGLRAEDFVVDEVLDRLVEEAADFIDRASQTDDPFFLYLPLTAPHLPAQPHARFRGRTGLGEYGDFVAQVDDAVGQVLEALDEAGAADETLVFFTSDNGSYMRRLDDTERDHVTRSSIDGYRVGRHRSNADWRGRKADIWEGGHRVPFVVRWPGVVGAGTETAATVVHTDLYATLADVVGVTLEPEVAPDSVSLLPMLRGEAATRDVPVVHHSGSGMFAIRHGPWKLVLGTGSGGRQEPQGTPFARPYQLFNLSRDPVEAHDVSAQQPGVAEQLEAAFERFRSTGRSAAAPVPNGSPVALESPGALTLYLGSSVAVDLSGAFSDPDGDALTYSAVSSSSPSVATATVSGSVLMVTAVSVGAATVTAAATDAGGSNTAASQRFAVTVLNNPPAVVGSLPALALREENAAATVDLSGAFSDPDGDELTYSAVSSSPSVATATVSGSVLTVTAVSVGAATVTAAATDAGGSNTAASQRFVVRVLNDPPVAVGALPALVLTSDAAAVDLSGAFSDPDGDALTYSAVSSSPSVAAVSVSGSVLTVTAMSVGAATVTVTATDASGSGMSAEQSFVVTVTASDYDLDGDGLIEIRTLGQLDAVRHDVDGDGAATSAGASEHAAAFPDALEGLGCPASGCTGYELASDLDFDTNGNGVSDAGDAWWNGGAGWSPIGSEGSPFAATFDGNHHELRGLHVAGGRRLGLFGVTASSSAIRRVGLVGVSVRGATVVGGLVGLHRGLVDWSYATGSVGGSSAGGLVGENHGSIRRSYSTARVVGGSRAGGLVGSSRGGWVGLSYATGYVSGADVVGGLVGDNRDADIVASYATGRVTGAGAVGGLVGAHAGGSVVSSFWDEETSGQATGAAGEGVLTSGLVSGSFRTWWAVNHDGEWLASVWMLDGSRSYPALWTRLANGDWSWTGFGYQVRTPPAVTATADAGGVSLSWTAVEVSDWEPAPAVTYAVYRTAGTVVERLATGVAERTYTDATASGGETYRYQVAAEVSGGEPTRSRLGGMEGAATVTVPVPVNGPPAPSGSLPGLTLLVTDGAESVEVSGAFSDADGDELTYAVSSSSPAVATASLSGSTVTVTPVSAGEATVTVTATDAGGSNASAVQAFAVRVSAVDYDADDDGLIEIATLSQLDAVRHDLDGDGAASAAGAAAYASAFPGAVSGMGCPAPGCGGYELAADLDLDTNGNGVADAGDGWWNAGSGWVPIGSSAAPFTSAFAGNGRTVSHLFANRGAGDYVGLFGMSRGTITGVGVVEADVTGRSYVGGLLGKNEGGEVRASYSTGRVAGYSVVGGLVGINGLEIRRGGPGQARWVSRTGALRASYSTAAVSADFRVGGLVGYNLATIAASYATGSVAAGATQAPRLESSAGGLVGWGASLGEVRASYSTGRVSGRGRHVGGLIGNRLSGHETTASYWDRDTSGVVASGGGSGHATSALQGPTAYTGLYASWDVDVDGDGAADRVWDFGTSSEYPALSVDVDGDGTATWRELGLQGRTASSAPVSPVLETAESSDASEPASPVSETASSGEVASGSRGPVAFTDDPLVAGVTPVRAVHLTELRSRVDGLRAGLGLPAFVWTDAAVVAGVTPVRAVHLTELRTALAAAHASAGRSAPVYTDAEVAAGVTALKAVHVHELRAAVAALEAAL